MPVCLSTRCPSSSSERERRTAGIIDLAFPQRDGQEVTVTLDSVRAKGKVIHWPQLLQISLRKSENNKRITENYEGENTFR